MDKDHPKTKRFYVGISTPDLFDSYEEAVRALPPSEPIEEIILRLDDLPERRPKDSNKAPGSAGRSKRLHLEEVQTFDDLNYTMPDGYAEDITE